MPQERYNMMLLCNTRCRFVGLLLLLLQGISLTVTASSSTARPSRLSRFQATSNTSSTVAPRSGGILSRLGNSKNPADEAFGDDDKTEMTEHVNEEDSDDDTELKSDSEEDIAEDMSTSTNATQATDDVDARGISTSKGKGRGPFGFFRPLESIKRKSNKTAVTDGDEENVEDALGSNSTTASDDDLSSLQHSSNMTDKSPSAENATQPASPGTREEPGESEEFKNRALHSIYGRPPQMPNRIMIMPQPNEGMVPPPHTLSRADSQRLILAGVSGVMAAFGRVWLLVWMIKRLVEEEELVSPQQHFRWERLNDRYSKDSAVFAKVMSFPALGFSRFQWSKYLKSLRPNKKVPADKKVEKKPQGPSRNVLVVDIAPSGQIDLDYITDAVNFLSLAHSHRYFGESPEIIVLVESGGGEVSTFGLAAAQVGRLKKLGLNVTVCVDRVAASGGYMMAVQANQLIAAPFAQLGSIGVIFEGLNFNKLITKYGIKPLVLTAGENKNRLSRFGEVSDEDLKDETKRLESIHEAFITMCLEQRPHLDPDICDGTVMVASQGIQHGIVDRVLTSEEYIWECIQEGAYVLKLRRAADVHPNFALFQVLNLLPHLKQKLGKLRVGKNLLSTAIQGAAIIQMAIRSLR